MNKERKFFTQAFVEDEDLSPVGAWVRRITIAAILALCFLAAAVLGMGLALGLAW